MNLYKVTLGSRNNIISAEKFTDVKGLGFNTILDISCYGFSTLSKYYKIFVIDMNFNKSDMILITQMKEFIRNEKLKQILE